MSESIDIELLGLAYGIVVLGMHLAAAEAGNKSQRELHLVRRETQLNLR